MAEPDPDRVDAPPPDTPPHRYDAALAGQIEARWQDWWARERIYEAPNPSGPLAAGAEAGAEAGAAAAGSETGTTEGRPKLFIMDMFPYPSGSGLHVGHPLGYIATDVYARFKRMTGFNVLHTMGFDAFGLPAEEHARQTGQHPRANTEANIANMSRQLDRLGLGHDKRRAIATTDVDYYRWTQWIFLQIFNSWFDPVQNRARARRRAGGRSRRRGPHPRRHPPPRGLRPARRLRGRGLGVPRRDGPAAGDRRPTAGLRGRGAGQLVPGSGHGAGQRGGDGRGPVRAGQPPGVPAPAQAVDDAHHRLRRPAVGRPRPCWSGPTRSRPCSATGSAAPPAPSSPSPPPPPRRPEPRGRGAGEAIEVFTTRPDTVFGTTFMVLAPEHPLVDKLTAPAWPDGTPGSWTGGAAAPAEAVADYRARTAGMAEAERAEGRDKTAVYLGCEAVVPVNGSRVPVFVADYVLMDYGTGAVMGVPGEDQRDWELAEKYGLGIIRTVQPPPGHPAGEAYSGEGPSINSGFLDGLGVAEAKARVIEWLEEKGSGSGAVTYKLRDWLFSRQRYWGEPFPVVFDDHGLPVALPESELPLELPDLDDWAPRSLDEDSEPELPLGRVPDWAEAELDLGDGPRRYRRELNTMPQWAGSCWYYLRYLDPTNSEALVDPAVERYWMADPSPGGPRRGGPVRGRGGARRAAPALRPVLAQGPLRPGPRVGARAVPAAGQPGLHPGRGLPGRTGRVRARGGGGGHGRGRFHAPGPPRHPGVRQDGQVAEELGHPRRHVRGLRGRHAAPLRDVHGPRRPGPALGDPLGGGVPADASAGVAQRGGRGHRRAAGERRAGGRRPAPGDAPHHCRGPLRHGGAAVQHRHRQDHRAEQRADPAGGPRPPGGGRRPGPDAGPAGPRTSPRSCGIASAARAR